MKRKDLKKEIDAIKEYVDNEILQDLIKTAKTCTCPSKTCPLHPR